MFTFKGRESPVEIKTLRKILTGILSNKSPVILSRELSIEKSDIDKVIVAFQIDDIGDARKWLNELSSYNEAEQNSAIAERNKQSKSGKNKRQNFSTGDNKQYKFQYNQSDAQKRLDAQEKKFMGKIPEDLQRRFKRDIELGFSQMRSIYGEHGLLKLNNEDLKTEIKNIRPDLEDEYFHIQGEQ